VKILLIEDDAKIAGFIKKGLKEAGYVFDHSEDGEDGLYLALMNNYDAAVIDIKLPKLDGLSIIKELRRKNNNLPILVLSAKSSVDDRVKGLEFGCDDYLTKPFAFSELLARIQALIRRASVVTEPSSLVFRDLSIDLLTRVVKRGEKVIELQPPEFTLLEYLMRNKERVISKTMIIEHVWNYNFDPQTNIVETRICRLRDKIDKGFDKKLIHTIRGGGYFLTSFTLPDIDYEIRTIYGRISPDYILNMGKVLEKNTIFLTLIRNTFFLLTLIIVGISAFAGFFIARRALKGVRAVTRAAYNISEGGALEQRVVVKSGDDEIEQLAKTFNKMLNYIQILVTEIKEIGENIAHDSQNANYKNTGFSRSDINQ
jgi:two-component system OmpR family response regulator